MNRLLTLTILTLIIFQTIDGFSQSTIESIKVNLSFRNQRLSEIFKQIEAQYPVTFAFGNDVGQLTAIGEYKNELLKNVLNDIASKSNLEYRSVGGQIAFQKKPRPKATQKIKGKVRDEHSNTPLPGAVVKILNASSPLNAVTNVDGSFIIEGLQVGNYKIEVVFMGYQSKVLDISIYAGKEVSLDIGLIESVNMLQGIVVSGYKNKVIPTNQMAVVSARSISDDEAQRFAGSLSDPSRMALSYAGVTSSNGYNNEIIVRGNSPRGLLWRLEGVEIPNPNHYAVEGSSGGFINILNSSNMARSDFFISAFPAEFGNATSGIFDLNMRKGNQDKREHTLEIATLGLRASTEGPLGKQKGSYLINYRYSTLGLLSKFRPGFDYPQFQDATFKVSLPSKNKGTFSIFGLGGLGKWSAESRVSFPDANQQEVLKKFYDVQRYDLGLIGASHAVTLKNNNTFLKSVIAVSATRNRPSSSNFNYTRMEPYIEKEGSYITSAYRAASTLNHKFSARNLITAGVKLNYLTYKLNSHEGSPEGTLTKTLEKSGNAGLLQSYVSWQFRPSDYWVVNTGVHTTYFSLSNQFIVEPRLGIERSIGQSQTISLGATLHSRHESIATYYGESNQNGQVYYPNQNLQLNRSGHLVLAYNLAISPNFHLKTESYLQYQYDIPVENNPQSSFSSINDDVSFTTKNLINEGVGKNYGVELTLEKNYSKRHYFLLTGSVFDARYKALDEIWRNTRYNTNYAANVVWGKDFAFGLKNGKQKLFGVNVRGAFSGGKRVVPLDLEASIAAGQAVEIPGAAYDKQLSNYHRLDFSMHYKLEGKKSSHQLKIDILNLLERNVYGIRYVPSKFGNPPRIKEYSFNEEDDVRSNLYPILSYRIDF